jgi:hypothetical protein
MRMVTRLEIITMPSANGMTPQQIRLFHLQASRAWGPFTQSEYNHLNSQKRRTRPEAAPPDFRGLIRIVSADVSLQDLKTVLMEGE